MKRSELWVDSACLQKDAGPQTITGAVCCPQYWDKDSLLPPGGRFLNRGEAPPSFINKTMSSRELLLRVCCVSSSLVQPWSCLVRMSQSLMKAEDLFLLLQRPTTTKC